ncbi:hypothetical protein ATER59S_05341 [Aquamicrobium terrae]
MRLSVQGVGDVQRTDINLRDDPDVEGDAEEDGDDLIDLLSDEVEVDADEFATLVRTDFVAKAFKALSADAQRGGGTLTRVDVNRTYLRRKLSIAECLEIETLLASAGHEIIEEDDDPPIRDGTFAANARRKSRYLTEAEERELGRRIQLALQLPEDTRGVDFHQELTRDFRRELTRLSGMFRFGGGGQGPTFPLRGFGFMR